MMLKTPITKMTDEELWEANKLLQKFHDAFFKFDALLADAPDGMVEMIDYQFTWLRQTREHLCMKEIVKRNLNGFAESYKRIIEEINQREKEKV